MKFDWKTLTDKIDDMSLRERGMIFGVAALILITLINTALLDPLLAKQKKLSQQVVQQEGQIKGVQAQTLSLFQSRPADPDAANRARLESLKQQLTQLDSFLQDKRQHLVPPEKITGLLEQILTRNRQLQLVSLQTLPAASLLAEQEQNAGKAPVAGAAPVSSEKQMYKHGVEISLKGSYFDMLRYVAELEKLPWRMFWGKASLDAEQYPALTLTLTVYTLSLDRAWLKV